MALNASKIKVGDNYEEVVVENLSRGLLVMYAGTSGDYNPLHTDEVYTTEIAGYPSVFAHGMISMGLTGKMLTNYVGDGRLKKYGVRFTNQVWPGDTLTAKATVDEIRDGEIDLVIETTNQDGKTVILGSATARIDG
jgi:acyl dehydratase